MTTLSILCPAPSYAPLRSCLLIYSLSLSLFLLRLGLAIRLFHLLPERRQAAPNRGASLLRHYRIHKHQRGHRLHNRHSAGNNTRIMPSLSLKHTLYRIVARRRLLLPNSRRRLEADAKEDRRAVRNSTLDTAAIISLGRDARLVVDRSCCAGRRGLNGRRLDPGIVVNGAGHFAAAEARADFEPFRRGDAKHGVRQCGFELVEDRLAKPDGCVADYARDRAADAVFRVAVLFDDAGHTLGGFAVGAANGDVGVDFVAGDGVEEGEEGWVCGRGGVRGGRWEEVLASDGGHPGDDLDAVD